jgi:hypothetical protein
LLDFVCKRYGVLPSDFIQRDPFWADFDTAIALKGQLEQNKLEEEALAESRTKSRKGQYHQSKPTTRSLKDKLRTAKKLDDIVKERQGLPEAKATPYSVGG